MESILDRYNSPCNINSSYMRVAVLLFAGKCVCLSLDDEGRIVDTLSSRTIKVLLRSQHLLQSLPTH